MKMVMAIVSRDQADLVLEALISAGYGATFTESRGGVLRQSQKTIFTAVEHTKLDDVLSIIRDHCRSQVTLSDTEDHASTTDVGSAVIFVWDLEQFITH